MTNSINCPVCGNLCSTQAISCPKCGHPISKVNQINGEENNKSNQNLSHSSSTGSILRNILWVFFAISVFIALSAIGTYRNQLYPVGADAAIRDFENKFAIVIRLIPLIIMIIVLAITYSAKERK